jgi:hypothetical protein
MRDKNIKSLHNRVNIFVTLVADLVHNRLAKNATLYKQTTIPEGSDFLDIFLHEYTQDATKLLTLEEI